MVEVKFRLTQSIKIGRLVAELSQRGGRFSCCIEHRLACGGQSATEAGCFPELRLSLVDAIPTVLHTPRHALATVVRRTS